jgi:hypothetical protein
VQLRRRENHPDRLRAGSGLGPAGGQRNPARGERLLATFAEIDWDR